MNFFNLFGSIRTPSVQAPRRKSSALRLEALEDRLALSTIKGMVFEDLNGNRVKDGNEVGTSGRVAYLDTNSNGVRDTTEKTATTDAAGNYTFSNLAAGTYRVRLETSASLVQTTSNLADVIFSNSAQTANVASIGTFRTASVSGQVFNDANGDGVKNGTEAGASGMTVFIDANGNGVKDASERSTTTNASGNYTLTNVGPGANRIRVVLPQGKRETTPTRTVTLTSGVNQTNINIGVGNVAAATLKVTNNSRYDVVSLKINGVEQIPAGSVVPVGGTFTISAAPGTYSLEAGVGFVRSGNFREVWFIYKPTASLTSNQTTTVTLSPMTIGQLLTLGSATGTTEWKGDYFDNNGGLHKATYRFSSNGQWQLFDDGRQIASGTLTLVSWPDRATIVQFKAANGETINLGFPFGSFQQRNGPASWPIISYVRQ